MDGRRLGSCNTDILTIAERESHVTNVGSSSAGCPSTTGPVLTRLVSPALARLGSQYCVTLHSAYFGATCTETGRK